MKKEQYVIKLSSSERQTLAGLLHKGVHHSRTILRARTLLLLGDGKTDEEAAAIAWVSASTVYRVKRRYAAEGLSAALYERPRSGTPPKTDARDEAVITAIACTDPPGGYDHWTVDLLCAAVKKRHREIGRMTLWRMLLKHDLKPWREKNVGGGRSR